MTPPDSSSIPVSIDADPMVAAGETARTAAQSAPASVARRHRPRLSRFVAASMRRRRHSAFYSRFVSLLKVVLPATAVVLAGLVLFWPQLNPLDSRFRLRAVQVSIDDLENLRMVSPRVVGTDAKNQPYTITAAVATQAAGGSELTELASPKGDIALNDGSWIALTANQGEYNKQTRILNLWDHVNVFHDAGYEIKTERAEADLNAGSVSGDDPVEGQGPDSSLRGQGFRIYNKGAHIVVTGKSRLVLYPQPPQPK
jgi:lipopolysaccharide export system protein LptC